MKRIYFLLLMAFTAMSTFAQVSKEEVNNTLVSIYNDRDFKIMKVYEHKGAIKDTFSKIKNWVVQGGNNWNATVKLEDLSNGRIIINGTFSAIKPKYSFLSKEEYILNITAVIDCKEDRFRIVLDPAEFDRTSTFNTGAITNMKTSLNSELTMAYNIKNNDDIQRVVSAINLCYSFMGQIADSVIKTNAYGDF